MQTSRIQSPYTLHRHHFTSTHQPNPIPPPPTTSITATMDADHLSAQARAAIDTLTQQLQHLEHQQTALLTSLHLTSSTLSTLPSYTAIAPTLAQIPHYETKLQRLKAAMAQQQRDVAELRRRALDAGARRRANLRRIEERRRAERERDRTVLRARVQQEEPAEPGDTKEPEWEREGAAAAARTVKRKKKARVAEIV